MLDVSSYDFYHDKYDNWLLYNEKLKQLVYISNWQKIELENLREEKYRVIHYVELLYLHSYNISNVYGKMYDNEIFRIFPEITPSKIDGIINFLNNKELLNKEDNDNKGKIERALTNLDTEIRVKYEDIRIGKY
jgi:hypothetical protein